MLNSGIQAPDFTVQLHTGETFRLNDIRGKHHLVLFFYPKDFSYGCTKESCNFRDHFGELRALGAMVLGVSGDPLESHLSFVRRYALPYSLASDADHRLARLYNVVGLGGFWLKRVTYVIDRGGVIQSVIHHEILLHAHLHQTIELLKKLIGQSA